MSELFKNGRLKQGSTTETIDTTEFNDTINNWDVSSVLNMSSMFDGASSFQQNLSEWDINNVTDFTDMFLNATEMSPQNIDSTPTAVGWNNISWDNLQSSGISLDDYKSFVRNFENSGDFIKWTIHPQNLLTLMEMDSTALTQYFSNNTYFDVIIYLKTRESTHTSDPTSEIKDAHSTETSNIIYKIIRFTSATELSTGYLSSVDLHNSTFDSLTTDTTDITNVAFTSSSTIDLQFKCINDDDNIIIGYFKNDGDTELTKVGLNSETFMIIFGEPNQIEAGP